MPICHDELKDSSELLDGNDSGVKISWIIRDLVDGLMRETDSREHRFHSEWGADLVARFKKHPGNPIVHLKDFVENSMINLHPESRSLVEPYWNQLGASMGYRWAWSRYPSIATYLHGRTATVARLKKWKDFGRQTGFNVNCLEPFVTSIRFSDGAHIRVLPDPKLPVNLATPAGARLIGYYGDLNSRNGAFSNKNPALHEDFRKSVREVFGHLTITESSMAHGGFGDGHYVRSNAGYIIPAALTVAGFDCSRDQTQANNPLPSWLFHCANPVKAECLSALWDAEGSVNYHDLKVRQAALYNFILEEELPSWPAVKPFRQLILDNQARIEESPPLLIVSAALLLYSLGIVSRLVPTGATMSHGAATAYWQLRVQREESIRAFHAQVKLRSPEKQSLLDSLVH